MNTCFTRILGRSAMEVSAVGAGCWAIGGELWWGDTPASWGPINDDETIRAIREALELGITLFDTADLYGVGHSEQILSQALHGLRHTVVIATKFGFTFDPATRQITGMNLSPEYLRQACEASLRRLNTDYLDLYQCHVNQCEPEQVDTLREGLEELVAAGKVRYYGWSTDFPELVPRFAQGAHFTTVQCQANLFNNPSQMFAQCEDLDLACINRGPLAMGLLTGKSTAASTLPIYDLRGENSGPYLEYFKGGKPNLDLLKKLEAIQEILRSGGRTLTQGALA